MPQGSDQASAASDEAVPNKQSVVSAHPGGGDLDAGDSVGQPVSGGTVTDGQSAFDPLVVAGVAGGVGTSTWVRLWGAAHGPAYGITIADTGHYTNGRVNAEHEHSANGRVEVLVSSNTAASTSRIGPTLHTLHQLARHHGYHQPPPVLVVMHTVPGVVSTLKADLITVAPHLTAILRVRHKQDWLGMAQPPGDSYPQHKDIVEALDGMRDAIVAMYLGGPTTSLSPSPAAPQPVQMRGMRHQLPAHRLGPTGGHPAIRAGPPPSQASVYGAHHVAMPRGRLG
ncbi:hypothetical protein [Lentzea sp. NPDC092896]|uniref:hypothetical protein n=1 Tax=Lentzea sp. NPDC092896 TaxID=3364127 RepID=UPI00381B8324